MMIKEHLVLNMRVMHLEEIQQTTLQLEILNQKLLKTLFHRLELKRK